MHCGRSELHGFSVASTTAYAAPVYLPVRRVEPEKQLTVRRLQLCAALLARLISILNVLADLAPQIDIAGWMLQLL